MLMLIHSTHGIFFSCSSTMFQSTMSSRLKICMWPSLDCWNKHGARNLSWKTAILARKSCAGLATKYMSTISRCTEQLGIADAISVNEEFSCVYHIQQLVGDMNRESVSLFLGAKIISCLIYVIFKILVSHNRGRTTWRPTFHFWQHIRVCISAAGTFHRWQNNGRRCICRPCHCSATNRLYKAFSERVWAWRWKVTTARRRIFIPRSSSTLLFLLQADDESVLKLRVVCIFCCLWSYLSFGFSM